MGVMANGAGNSQPNGTWPEVRSGPLIVGGSLIGIGVAVAAVGLAVAGSHVVSATRQWLNSLETPPSQFAQLKWEQAKTAAASGGEHLAGAPQRQGTPDAARAIGELTTARG